MPDIDELAWVRQVCRTGEAREIRLAAEVSLAETGAGLDPPVAPRTVHRWERAERLPRGDHAHQYAAILRRLRRLNRRKAS